MPAWFPTTNAVRMFQNNTVGGKEEASQALVEVLHTYYGGGKKEKKLISTFNKILCLISGYSVYQDPKLTPI